MTGVHSSRSIKSIESSACCATFWTKWPLFCKQVEVLVESMLIEVEIEIMLAQYALQQ